MTLLVGLTGGIGSGKSTVAARFAERGAHVVDADRIAHEVVAPGSDGLAAVVDRFGEDVVTDDGTLDRAALAGIVFSDADARADLNAILHPRIGAVTGERIAAIRDADPDGIVVHDIALLVENDMAGAYAAIVVVVADPEVRVRRLAEHRGMDPDDARARMASQATDEERAAVATHVIRNDDGLDALRARCDQVWEDLVALADRASRDRAS